MNYTLNQLKIYLKVCNTLSITKAAEDLHLTQPAVSIQLKNFQDQFEIPLIEVINKKIYITDFGKEIEASAEKILEEVYAINFKMHTLKGNLTGKLKISIVSTGKYIAPYFISDFMKKYEGVELLMDVTNKSKVLESLEKNLVDFSLVSVLPENFNLKKIELMENKLFLVGNKEQYFSQKIQEMSILEKLPIIYREQGSGTRHVMENFIFMNKLNVIQKMELTSNEAVKQAVIAGLGYSIMPLIGIKNELENGQLQIIPIEGFPITSTWNLIWLADKKHSPAANEYLNFIKKEKVNIMLKQFNWLGNY